MTDYYCDENIKRVQRCEHGPAGFSTGDGHKMGLWVGAHMQDGPFPLMLHPQACSMFHGCFPFVNQEGHRFMNEGTWVQGKSMNIMHQTGNVACPSLMQTTASTTACLWRTAPAAACSGTP